LEDKCTAATTKRVNKVSGFHSFLKERMNAARAFATIYLNRYNALFSKIYASDKSAIDEIYELMISQSGRSATISTTHSANLLNI
jgi:spore coat protein CotH